MKSASSPRTICISSYKQHSNRSFQFHPSPVNPNLSYRPDIDGLRAIAVLAVVLHHLSAPLVPGGPLSRHCEWSWQPAGYGRQDL